VTRSQAIEHFGSVSALASALSISKAAVFAWGETIPELRQHQLEKLTAGKLRAEGPAAIHLDHPDLMQAAQDLLLAVSNFHRTLGAATAAAAGMVAGPGASDPPGQSVA